MNTTQWTPVLVALFLAIGTVEAFADSGWHHDEGSDTAVFVYTGEPVAQATGQHDTDNRTGSWYYQEGSDSIVYNNTRNRSEHARKHPSNDAFGFDPYLAFLDQ